MVSLTWGQVNAWRISQHLLTQRLESPDMLQAVSRVLGVHAQVISAAEMAIAARVDGLSPQAIQSALWQDHTLVKTWLMRQTTHLIPSTDFPLYIAARRITDINWPVLFSRNGIDRATFDAYIATAPEILSGEPLTRQQFAHAVGERTKSSELRTFLTSQSWGTPFKPLAWRGELCYGPGNGQNATYVSPRAWIGEKQDVEPAAAMQEIVRRYLRVYGPSRVRNFQVWWWMSGVAARNAFKSIADETEEVDVEGWRATALKAAIQPMLEEEPTGEVHLLPAFDVYTVGLARGKDLERLFTLEHQKKVYRPQGWISAVILVDGFIKGTWEHKEQRASTSVRVSLFNSVSDNIKEGIAAEAERVGRFLNSNIELQIE